MKIKQIYTSCLSQASYYIESNGESLIIDPIKDINEYDKIIKKDNSKLKYVLETHFHADFISGHLEISNKYNVPIVFGPHSNTSFKSMSLNDNDIIKLGDISIKVLHTPGHTLESVCYLLYDNKNKENALFTGDTLFIGDIGRPDLAVNNNLSVKDLASMLYDSLYNKILKLDDDILIYPAHGPGTQCGKNLSQETFSTLYDQKQNNYALKFKSKYDFINSITKDLPSAPEYFIDSAILNKDGYKNNDDLIKGSLKKLSVEKIKNPLELNHLILDTRSPHDFFISHIKKSLNIPLSGRYAITAANLLGIKKSVILVCYKNDINESIIRLNRVGFENIIGYYILDDLTPKNITSSIKSIKANSAHKIDDSKYLDVRTKSEYAEKHVRGALNLPLFELNESINLLDKDSSYIVYCRSGYRSSVASSILKRNNINNIINISEGINGLSKNKSISFSLL
tara:strand:+ start:1204 stop:2568 length:1365 start_codon:yes stop_codon:yes gene_type:complete